MDNLNPAPAMPAIQPIPARGSNDVVPYYACCDTHGTHAEDCAQEIPGALLAHWTKVEGGPESV